MREDSTPLDTEVADEAEEIGSLDTEDITPPDELEADTAESTLDCDLAALKEGFGELADISSITQLENPTRYAALRDLGLTPEEAYLATSHRKRIPSTRAHLTSSVPKSASGITVGISSGELRAARELFSGLSDVEIQKLYKKVTNK